jgi:hypothetical protein
LTAEFLEDPGLSKDEIFEHVERFHHRYYLRPKLIYRIIKTVPEDKDVCVVCAKAAFRNGGIKSLKRRWSDLAATQAAA